MEIDHVVLATRSRQEAEQALAEAGLGIARGRELPGLGLSNLVVPLRHGQLLEVHYPNGKAPAPGAPPLLRFDSEALELHPEDTLIPVAWLVAVEEEARLRELAARHAMSLIEAPAEGPGFPPYLLAGFGQNFARRYLPCLIHWSEGFPPLRAEHGREPVGITGIDVAGPRDVIEDWCGDRPAGLRTVPGTSGAVRVEIGFADGGTVTLGVTSTA
ncbi:VOC family protein [Glycomyces niveus]|uniref:VOC family protein n=1 Tax=Glycomyces niveus TaxID=2820287 RepID=A0ABS3U2M9_9ACTN|nr:VOC family protein [Glycomyces sp. NEAU-S30]MBO3733026.1 VOC family protein [Glycomyces sp. NEAU-S30]